jgi:hypothetical protein
MTKNCVIIEVANVDQTTEIIIYFGRHVTYFYICIIHCEFSPGSDLMNLMAVSII